MIKPVRSFIGTALLGVAAFASAPVASAAIITGSWDPVLPAPFVNLGWVATVNLQTNNNCVLNAGGTHTVSIFGNSFGCASAPVDSQFSVASAQVGLYSTLTGAIVEVLTFVPPSNALGVDLLGPLMNNYILTLNESQTVSSAANGPGLGLGFRLRVPGELPVLSYQDTANPGTFLDATGDPFLTLFTERPDAELAQVLEDTALVVGQIVVEPADVPEPGSLALTLLALGAAGAVASRRTRRAA